MTEAEQQATEEQADRGGQPSMTAAEAIAAAAVDLAASGSGQADDGPTLYVLHTVGDPDSAEPAETHLSPLPIPAGWIDGADPADALRTIAGVVSAVGLPPGFARIAGWLYAYRDPAGGLVIATVDTGGGQHTGGADGPDAALLARVYAALAAVNRAALRQQ